MIERLRRKPLATSGVTTSLAERSPLVAEPSGTVSCPGFTFASAEINFAVPPGLRSSSWTSYPALRAGLKSSPSLQDSNTLDYCRDQRLSDYRKGGENESRNRSGYPRESR